MRGAGFAADALAFDMADRAAMRAEVSRAGPIDILVHNVGERDRRPFAEIEPEDFARLIDVDLTAAPCPGQAGGARHDRARLGPADPGDLDRGRPRRAGRVSYIAAKGGLSALARALAAELGDKGITSNALSPGFFATETNAQLIASPTGERQRVRCPAKRWAEPSEIAGAALFLASPAASYVNGHTLTVDGGVSATYLA